MKAFSWSFSKLKNYEVCPRRHNEIDLQKNFTDESGEALVWGNKVHQEFAKALKNNTPLPDEMKDYQHWVDSVRNGPGELLVEQKYAITKSFQPTEWFGPRAWYRGVADAVRIDGPVALVVDWKTGKILVDSVQLMLMAQCIFANFPKVKRVRSEYVWLKEDCSTPEVYSREDVAGGWVGLLPRVEALSAAAATQSYPPKPGRLCYKWCPVSSCEFHGKSFR